MEGATAGSAITQPLVFLPFVSVAMDGLLTVVISQKLRFFVVGAGDLKR